LSTALILHLSTSLNAQPIKFEKSRLEPNLTYMSIEKMMGETAVRVVKDSTVEKVDEPTLCENKRY